MFTRAVSNPFHKYEHLVSPVKHSVRGNRVTLTAIAFNWPSFERDPARVRSMPDHVSLANCIRKILEHVVGGATVGYCHVRGAKKGKKKEEGGRTKGKERERERGKKEKREKRRKVIVCNYFWYEHADIC